MKFALIGKKLGHSYSAVIHEKRGLDYKAVELAETETEDFCKTCERGEGYAGFNVTMPYKISVMPYLKGVSEEAKAVGAVNTVAYRDGGLYGYNTDVGGLKYSFKRMGVSVHDKVACILGGGGAAAAAKAFLSEAGAKKIYSVTRKGEVNFDNYARLKDTEILINATPVGMYPNPEGLPADITVFPALEAVFDCVYNPQRTKLVYTAKKAGIKADTGLSMLVEQALLAEDIWLGGTHSAAETEELIRYVYGKTLNLILIGMPSCGKSRIGRLVAEKLGREFFDSDEVITEKTGNTPEEIIRTRGEESFRKTEREILNELSAKSGAVIATGGGAVTVSENVYNLSRNGVLIYLKRDAEKLIAENRPISEKEGIIALQNKRKPLYEAAAEETADNNGDIEHGVKEVLKAYETACDKRAES